MRVELRNEGRWRVEVVGVKVVDHARGGAGQHWNVTTATFRRPALPHCARRERGGVRLTLARDDPRKSLAGLG